MTTHAVNVLAGVAVAGFGCPSQTHDCLLLRRATSCSDCCKALEGITEADFVQSLDHLLEPVPMGSVLGFQIPRHSGVATLIRSSLPSNGLIR